MRDAVARLRPADLAGGKLNAPQICDAVLAAVNAVEKATVLNRRGVLARQSVVTRPNRFCAACAERSINGSDAVARRYEELVANDQRCGGVHGRAAFAE